MSRQWLQHLHSIYGLFGLLIVNWLFKLNEAQISFAYNVIHETHACLLKHDLSVWSAHTWFTFVMFEFCFFSLFIAFTVCDLIVIVLC